MMPAHGSRPARHPPIQRIWNIIHPQNGKKPKITNINNLETGKDGQLIRHFDDQISVVT